jgi:trk system potassium uptake protein TrkA
MKVLICGVGSIGSSLIHYLSLYYEIVAIDTDAAALERISSAYDVQTICGSASDPSILEQAGLSQNSYVLGVTQWDEVNLVACHLSHLFSGVTTMARLENRAYFQQRFSAPLSKYFELDADFSSHRVSTSCILTGLDYPYCFDALPIFNESAMVLGIQMMPFHPWVGKSVADIQGSSGVRLIRIITHHNQWIPKACDVIGPYDALYGIVDLADVPSLHDLHDCSDRKKTILCLGSSPILFSFLPHAMDKGLHITLLSDNEDDLFSASQQCPGIQLIQGPYNDPKLLKTALKDQDTVISMGPSDEHNILAAVIAHSYGVKHTMACIENLHYLSPLCVRGVNQMIHSGPRIVMDILKKITQQNNAWVYPLQGMATGMVIQAYVQPESKMAGTLCQDWQEDRWRIVALYRNNVLIWNPETIDAGDHILATALPEGYEVFQQALVTPSLKNKLSSKFSDSNEFIFKKR